MLSFALWSTASILTPINSVSSAPIAAARMAVGVSQGLLIPSIHTVLAQVSKHPAILPFTTWRLQASSPCQSVGPASTDQADMVMVHRSCRQSSAPRRCR